MLPNTGSGSLRCKPSAEMISGLGSENDAMLSSSENETRAVRLRLSLVVEDGGLNASCEALVAPLRSGESGGCECFNAGFAGLTDRGGGSCLTTLAVAPPKCARLGDEL